MLARTKRWNNDVLILIGIHELLVDRLRDESLTLVKIELVWLVIRLG